MARTVTIYDKYWRTTVPEIDMCVRAGLVARGHVLATMLVGRQSLPTRLEILINGVPDRFEMSHGDVADLVLLRLGKVVRK